MVKLNFTLQHLYRYVIICSLLSTTGLYTTKLQAQCALACTGTVQVSLDMNCQAEITPDMVLNDDATSCEDGVFEVIIQDQFGNDMPFPLSPNGYPIVDGSLIGYPAYVKILDTDSQNSCWGNLVVEDKLPPMIYCPDGDEPLSIDFEGLTDLEVVNDQFVQMGIQFVGMNRILQDGSSLNSASYPPSSGINVLDADDLTDEIRINALNVTWSMVSFNYTSASTLFLEAYDSSDNLLASVNGAANLNGTSVLTVSADDIAYVIIHDSGSQFIVDDLEITPEIVTEDDIFCYELIDFHPLLMKPECGPVTFDLTYEDIDVNDCTDTSIDPEILKTITRTYVATDKWGNKSEPCTFTFNVLRHDEDAVEGPENFFNDDGNAFSCGHFEYDHYGNPIIDPAITGVPYLDLNGNGVQDAGDIPLYPEPEVYCNVVATFDDLYVNVGCVLKVVRTWTIIEWNCDPRTFDPIVQMIEIADNTPPEIDAHHDITVSSNIPMDYYHPNHGQINCGAHVNLPMSTVHDNCDYDDVSVTINIYDLFDNPVDFVDGNGGYASIPLGRYYAVYEAFDKCYNTATDTIDIYVQDLTPPVTVCDQNTVVSLNHQDGTHVYVESLDEGSYDDCQLARVVGRRMDADTCDCPVGLYGFHYLGRYGDKEYYISKHDYTAKKAKSEAEALEGHVFSFTGVAERNWVYDKVFEHANYSEECFWVGLKRDYGGDYVWQDGNDFPDGVASNMWAIGEPDNSGDCTLACYDGSTYTRTFYDMPCDDPINYMFPYVLEMPVCGFSDAVSFCCEDAGQDPVVIVRAIDANCNYNDCMVSVEVQDKTAPSLFCPDDMTVDCDQNYDLNNLGNAFGEAYIMNTCGGDLDEEPEVDLNQCNEGKIVRTFTATSSGGTSVVCHQTIYFEHENDFYVNCDDPTDPTDDVVWPSDLTMFTGCDDPTSDEYHPDVTGYPEFLNGNECRLVGSNWHDEIFAFNSNNQEQSCFKILRTWTIIDWCSFIQGEYFTCSYTQVIKLNNTDAPYFDEDFDCSPKAPVCTFDEFCQEGWVELNATAHDSCTTDENLTWEYEIDFDYDPHYGSFDNDLTTPHTGNGNFVDASAYYPIGNHLIRWTFYDRCGNKVSCDQEFSVVNCLQPTPYCHGTIAIDLGSFVDVHGDTIGMVELWASDFDLGSFHPCNYDVVGHFDPDDITATNIVFTCDDFGLQEVMVWFTAVDYAGNPVYNAEGDLLQNFCLSMVDVQDNQGFCPDTGMRYGIQGSVTTEAEVEVSDVMIDLIGSEADMEMTDESGSYAFPDMPMGNNYDVDPLKDDDHLNGVSTLDVVLIQRHVLGMEPLDSPYKAIAADINNDATVSAIDIVELRKLILGVYTEFPSNESWRFVDKQFVFNDNNPFDEAFPEIYSILNLNTDMVIDFVGMKVGDVNNSAIANLSDGTPVESRSTTKLELEYALVGNEIQVFAGQNYDLYGMQFTAQLPASMEITSIDNGQLSLSADNVGFVRANTMTISWNELTSSAVSSETPLFTMTTNGLGDVNELSINSSVTKSEAYDAGMNVMEIELAPRNAGANQFALMQNVPNPFSDQTVIQFRIPTQMDVEFTIHDVTGKVVERRVQNFEAGEHNISFEANGLAGVHYYTMKAGLFSLTKKMVVIK